MTHLLYYDKYTFFFVSLLSIGEEIAEKELEYKYLVSIQTLDKKEPLQIGR